MRLIDHTSKDFDSIYASFEWQIPERLNIAHQVCERHQQNPDKIAVYYENSNGQTSEYTFGQLKKYSDKFANSLEGLGINRGDRVAIVLSQRIETIIAHLAIYKLGAIALPLAILFGPDALSYRLADSASCAIILDQNRYDDVIKLAPELPNLNHIIGCGTGDKRFEFWHLIDQSKDRFNSIITGPDDPACLIYTSGTTGPPKGALIAHRAVIGNFSGFELSQNLFPEPNDVFWTPADWAWTGGLWDGLLPSLNYGIPILAYEGRGFDPERVLALLQKYRITNSFIPPTALKMLRAVSNSKNASNLNLRAIMSAGEQVGEELIHWGREQLRVTINEMWGQTEFNYLVGNCSKIMTPKPGSMGKPYPGHRVDIINPRGDIASVNEHGELAAWCDDPVMFLGYWKNDQAGKDKVINNWFRTGDIGYRDEDGFLWFVGRKDDVISSAGYRIGPGEIEDSLLKHPAVLQAAVIGKPDPLRGEIVKAFIVTVAGCRSNEILGNEIQQFVRQRLSAHEYPREVEFVDSLPMTTTGKVKRIDLRQKEIDRQTRI
ncbi:MAG: acetyl-CoA synthetase [Gammaproteobacteria bacterium]|jgi:acetyl-CoA synthetase